MDLYVYEGDFTTATKTTIHALPCKIEYTGPASVDTYLLIKEDTEQGVLTTNFRGRRLLGAKVNLPEHAVGLIVREEYEFNEADKEDDEFGPDKKCLKIDSWFDSVFVWNQDSIPRHDNNPTFGWIDHLKLARAIHGNED